MGLRNDLNALFNQFVNIGIVGLSKIIAHIYNYSNKLCVE